MRLITSHDLADERNIDGENRVTSPLTDGDPGFTKLHALLRYTSAPF
jgi:hypothetical protein